MNVQPPAAVIEDLERLRAALDQAIPAKGETSLLIGTWNVRALGDLAAKWLAGPKDSPKRDWRDQLATVISHFEVVAVQESRRNPKAMKRLFATLGPKGHVVISDVTEGAAGNGERIAFLYDSERVQPSGLVGEIVLPPVGGSGPPVRPHPVDRQLRPGLHSTFTTRSPGSPNPTDLHCCKG
jgi:hypothetical protein